MMGRVVLTLPLPPNIANPGRHWGHWAVRRKRKAEWVTQAALAVHLDFPSTCFVKASVHCHFFVWNLMDADNLVARQKWVLDFLKAPQATIQGKRLEFGGWIADDDGAHLELRTPEQAVARKNRRVVVTIHDLASPAV